MNHTSLSLTRCEYAYQVYELLARIQVGEDLNYDNDRLISVAGVQACCYEDGTEITFPDPYTDKPAWVVVSSKQAPTVVVAMVEAFVTRFASHLAFAAAEAAGVYLHEEVD